MVTGCAPSFDESAGAGARDSAEDAAEPAQALAEEAQSAPAEPEEAQQSTRSDAEYGQEALDALAGAQTAEPAPGGYQRALFGYGPSEALDGDGCSTRQRVLIEQAVQAPQKEPGCRLAGGAWLSRYDMELHHGHGGLQVDHIVPLFEAWQSGAHAWPEQRRRDFANDSWQGRSLVAVTGELNEDKSADGPEQWMPPQPGARCWYVWAWAGTKQRWELSYDEAELEAVTEVATSCADQ